MQPPETPAMASQTEFAGRTLVRRMAVGGMAEVFLAEEPRPVGEPRRVVLKRLLPEVAVHPGAVRMFRTEGLLGSYLKHPNLVEVRETGVAKDESGSDRAYITMEYVRGIDLWQLHRWMMAQGEVLPIPVALAIGDALLAGLAFAHEAVDEKGNSLRIVHRDVSPSNILLSHHGEVKLGDFGIAQSSLHAAESGFEEERAKGKLGYLSPEQVRGEPCSQATDIFAAGVVIAETLIGRPIFAGSSELAILLAIRDAKISTFTDALGHLPSGLGETVVSALQAAPHNRIQSARELRESLQVFQKEDAQDLQRKIAQTVANVLQAKKSPRSRLPSVHPDEPRLRRKSSQEAVDRVTAMTDLRAEQPLTPAVHVTSMPVDSAPMTELETIVYSIRTRHAEEDNLDYAQIVERVNEGLLGEDDMVSKNGGAYIEASKLPELARHLAGGVSTTREVMRSTQSDRVVSLETDSVIGLLCEAAHKKQTGLWIFTKDDVRKEVYLEDGKPRFVTSNLKSEMLGEHLVAQRVIERSELDMALAVMPRYQGRLGDTLTALGLVEPVQLFQHIEEQVRSKLLEVFTWPKGQASYYAGIEPPESAFPLEIEPWQLIGKGCHLRVAAGLEDARFKGRENDSLVLRDDYDPSLLFETLPSDAQVLLMTIERPRRFDDIDAASGGASSRDMRAAIVFLIELGVARWVS